MSAEPEAILHRLHVALTCEQAFDLFTRGMSRWWPFRDHSCSAEDAPDVRFEERLGGAVTEIARDGTRHPWGTLTAWEPPTHFADAASVRDGYQHGWARVLSLFAAAAASRETG